MVARTLKVVQMLPDLDEGGVERGTVEMARWLVGHGHESIVVSNGGRLVSRLLSEGSRHVRLPVGEKNPRLLRTLAPLVRLLRKGGCDVLHLRSRLPAWAAWTAMAAVPESRGPAVVSTFHGIHSVNPYSAVMARGDAVIAISHFVADHVRENYRVDSRRLVVIHRGFDPAHFDPDAVEESRVAALRRAWQVGDDAPVILAPGRITRLKGHDVLLRALSAISGMDWVAVCLGEADRDSGYFRELKALARDLGIADRVVFAGHADDMAAAYGAARVVAATSVRPEAFGRVPLEAQAMGVPVVATAHGGFREIVAHGKTGLLVPPGDAAALGRALGRFLADPEMAAAMGGEGRQASLGRTTDAMCGKTFAVYEKVVGEREAGG
ncbi:MAG: glycosyltransferase family 4 protein [Desulfatibacillaceae bacterium]